MKNQIYYVLLLLAANILISTSSCSKSFLEQDSATPVDLNVSHSQPLFTYNPNLKGSTIRYKITGDIAGKVNFYFGQADGSNVPYGNLNETKIPWDFSYEEIDDIYAVGGYAIGAIQPSNDYFHGPLLSEDIGKTLDFEFYVDDRLIETAKRTISDEGFIVIGTETSHSLPIYYLNKQISNSNLGKQVTYEIIGDFSENELHIVYMDENVVIHSDIIESLPWSYRFIASEESKIARVYFMGTTKEIAMAEKGETVTINVYVGGDLVRSATEIYDDTINFGFIVPEYPLYEE